LKDEDVNQTGTVTSRLWFVSICYEKGLSTFRARSKADLPMPSMIGRRLPVRKAMIDEGTVACIQIDNDRDDG